MGKVGDTPNTRATRARIVTATATVIGGRGIRGVAIRDLLEASGVSRRTFYLHFANFDEVLVVLYDDVMTRMLTGVVEAVQQADGDRIDAAVHAYLQFHIDEGPLLTVIMSESMAPYSVLAPRRVAALANFEEMFRSIEATPRDPLLYRALFSGLGTMVMHAKADGPLDEDRRARVHAVMATMIRAVLGS